MSRGLSGMAMLASALTACFHPSYDAPQCSAQGECPSGFTCGANNVCVRPAPIDAALSSPPPVAIDAPYIPTDSAPITGAPECLGTFIKVCVGQPSPTSVLTLPVGTTLDTDTSTLCVPYTATPNVDACVIASGNGIVLPAGVLHVTGRRKLILLSFGKLSIEGTLDVASHPGSPGPASDIDACGTGATAPVSNMQGGGGFGGSFGGVGGAGGASFSGGVGGQPGAVLSATVLRAGCSGGAGAPAQTAGLSAAGAGGRGGGALYMVAISIFIDGVVNASGAGGEGAPAGSSGGGGGGGTGGMIVLEARNNVQLTGQCFANGGGGGGGANNLAGPSGGDASAPSSPGAGGGSAAASASGGIGGSAANAAGAGVAGGTGTGGGGGGGSVGIIMAFPAGILANSNPAQISPLPTN